MCILSYDTVWILPYNCILKGLKDTLKEYDEDGDGYCNFKEFVRMIENVDRDDDIINTKPEGGNYIEKSEQTYADCCINASWSLCYISKEWF